MGGCCGGGSYRSNLVGRRRLLQRRGRKFVVAKPVPPQEVPALKPEEEVIKPSEQSESSESTSSEQE